MKPLYLDHNATSPTRPEVLEAMMRCYAEGFANPASQHQPGQHARRVLEDARERVAAILGASLTCPQADRLIFTASGTESNNLAMLGIAKAGAAWKEAVKGSVPLLLTQKIGQSLPSHHVEETGQIVISSIEHQSIIEPAEHLLEQGWRLDTLAVTHDGVVRVENLSKLLSDRTRLVSVIWANHETGVIQPILKLAEICNNAGVFFHTDAVQAVGKIPVDFRASGVSALSLAAHKFQGPVGIGALLLRHDVPIAPIEFGGHQQYGIRPGTESVPLAVGMLTALELWQKEEQTHYIHLESMHRRFEDGLKTALPEIIIHSAAVDRLPQTSNIAFPSVDAQILLMALDISGVACSVGSACSSGSTELSPTLRAMGLPNEIVASSLRFSLGGSITEEDIEEAVARIVRVCKEIRS
jgi:cysteine desulfurase